MLPKIEIQDIHRLSNVARWQIVRTERQSVAEHSFNVAYIVINMLDRLKIGFGSKGLTFDGFSVIKHHAVEWAIFHDLSELFIGDIPTPIKKKMAKHARSNNFMKNFESETVHDKFLQIPPEVRYKVRDIVKIADMMEAISFLTRHNNDKKHSSIILKEIHDDLKIAVAAFMEYFPEYSYQGEIFKTTVGSMTGNMSFSDQNFV